MTQRFMTSSGIGGRVLPVACLSFALCLTGATAASATPGHASEPGLTEFDSEEAYLDYRLEAQQSEDRIPSDAPSDVTKQEVSRALNESDGILARDIEYAAAVEQLSESTDSDFYTPPGSLPATEGALIKTKPGTWYIDPIKLIEPSAESTTFMYRTTDSNGTARAATATLLEPTRKWRGKGDRPTIVVAPGTQGVADKCAPSRQMAVGTEYESIAIAGALTSGASVIVTDYIGLGTPGMHTYMNRVDQGKAVLDSVRAAKDIEASPITDASPIQLRGYSQGGAASASAIELAERYAPDLNVTSGSSGAVPQDMSLVLQKIDGSLYNGFLMYALASFEASDGVVASDYLNAEGMQRYTRAIEQCTISALLGQAFVDTETLTHTGESLTELAATGPIRDVLDKQTIGNESTPTFPVQLTHSVLDDVIPFETGKNLAKLWCDRGVDLRFDRVAIPTHVGGNVGALPKVEAFTRALQRGLPVPSNCWAV